MAKYQRESKDDGAMKKLSVIVHGPQGCGKTHNKEKLKTLFGLSEVVDDWMPSQKFDDYDTLYITFVAPDDRLFAKSDRHGALTNRCVSFLAIKDIVEHVKIGG